MSAHVMYSVSARCYYGEIIGRDYVISFQSKIKRDLPAAMRQAVDQFLACSSSNLRYL
jgi:predicted HicB family RNase H-like nuclease